MRIDGFSGQVVEINYVGGPLPYLWLGADGHAVATVQRIAQLRQLVRWANKIIEKLEEYPLKHSA